MTPRQQNLALALHMGWQLKWQDPETLRVLNPHGNLADLAYCNGRTQEETVNDLHYCFPNYHGDLNAVAEVEKTIESCDQGDYRHWISIVLDEQGILSSTFAMIVATAPQRCEAILRTLNLWQE